MELIENKYLRKFSKLTAAFTLFLIFAGGMVTSTGSGLAVPDWPLSYGMVFPPMVGGVLYEHGHRLIASSVGFLTLIMAIWVQVSEKRSWVKKLSLGALGLVILQGLLGGLTVLFMLPTPISASHAVTGQTFFVVTIILAYSLSCERKERLQNKEEVLDHKITKLSYIFIGLLYLQLILGAVMRHTHSGLAIPDFPLMGGQIIPLFNESMLSNINNYLSQNYLANVQKYQVIIHFTHRLGAILVTGFFIYLFLQARKLLNQNRLMMKSINMVLALVIIQFTLGVITVLTHKNAILASAHVATGALTLGSAVLLALRSRVLPKES